MIMLKCKGKRRDGQPVFFKSYVTVFFDSFFTVAEKRDGGVIPPRLPGSRPFLRVNTRCARCGHGAFFGGDSQNVR